MPASLWGRVRASLIPVAVALLALPAAAQDLNRCGPIENATGPWDFRTTPKDRLVIVTAAHFPPIVESLVRGSTNTTPGGDLDYTLRAIPNHPNALVAVMNLGEKEKTQMPYGMRYTVECYFERALRFRPDDLVARMIYVAFLTKNKRKDDAMQQLDVVAREAKEENPFTYYNLGLLYFDLGEYEKSAGNARKAWELGLERPDLRDKLKAAGKWQESAVVAAPRAGSSAPSSP